ncbi:hypothetical protein BSPWISOXPB_7297 [uncultured Gammaproteobacteria bacterium]|nr:hypothetical protein BSPWISOXPB_7297 [uncultured Gammaproteobacteria bacterium]
MGLGFVWYWLVYWWRVTGVWLSTEVFVLDGVITENQIGHPDYLHLKR